MHRKSQAKTRMRQRACRIPGITRAASDLGVTRQHLRLVLIGERSSPRLLRRYQALHGKGGE